jgi:carbamoyltransferase
MTIFGLSYGFHDAAYSYLEGQDIVEAHHSERHSRIKNDRNLHTQIDGFSVFYEKPFKKNIRRFLYGQRWVTRQNHDAYIDHHWSHAAAAYYTRPYEEEPVCVVIDAIGEWDTASIWYKKKKKWSMKYPKSLGLFYSAITKAIKLKPNEDEYITMGMAAYGNPHIKIDPYNNYHKGIYLQRELSDSDIAASAQAIIEHEIIKIMTKARKYSRYLCYGGGVALNCVANTKVHSMFDKMWILPNPGDAGSSLGAAAAYLDKQLNWIDPYLGTDIKRDINVKEVVKYLIDNSYCGIANGRAEFGPRALGNRSLIADPRKDIKDTVNQIKRRQKFRPFAPAILEEFADEYFEGPMNEYMQYVAKAKHDHKSVTHVDGTARVQVVKKDCKSVIRPILEEWYEQTKCPMLLNTSLNIKGKPMVDNLRQAKGFEKIYGVKVF